MYLLNRLNGRQNAGNLHISTDIVRNNRRIRIAQQKRTHIVRTQADVDRVGFLVVNVKGCRMSSMQWIKTMQGKVQHEVVEGVQRQ